MNLLFVEDNEGLQKLLGSFLESCGFNFDVASNGQEAVSHAISNEGKYDLCFMDTSMPIMNGFEATKIIRKKVKYFPILSTSIDQTYKRKLLKLGADDFIEKPYNLDALLDKINELTVKALSFMIQGISIICNKETPMNKEELLELQELKKKGLTKLKLIGTDHVFIVHKNIQNKISHDLIGEGKELTIFIDRSVNEPGKCHLYKANLHVTKDIFIPEELEKAIKEEDQIAIKYTEAIEKKATE